MPETIERRTITVEVPASFGSITFTSLEPAPAVEVEGVYGGSLTVPIEFPADTTGLSWQSLGDTPEVTVTVSLTADFVVKS
jgi:hypothetical protein